MLERKLDMKDLGFADVILGIRTNITPQVLPLTQSYCMEMVFVNFKYLDFNFVKTPLDVIISH